MAIYIVEYDEVRVIKHRIKVTNSFPEEVKEDGSRGIDFVKEKLNTPEEKELTIKSEVRQRAFKDFNCIYESKKPVIGA